MVSYRVYNPCESIYLEQNEQRHVNLVEKISSVFCKPIILDLNEFIETKYKCCNNDYDL